LAGEGRKQVDEQVKAWEAADKPEDDPRAQLAEKLELFDESMEIADDILEGIAFDWLEAADDVIEVPSPPADIPVADNYAEFIALGQGDKADALAASVKRGRELFVGKNASCSKCHGEKGLGDGQNKDYDDWTKDWTTRAGLKPEDAESLIPLMARGAMPPKVAMPRNFTEGVFHGGESAEDLYRRIFTGIDGTPMPGATFVPGQFEQDDIWHLINFVRSIKEPEPEVTTEG
jgi:mono/diheme cytochrome c family protein